MYVLVQCTICSGGTVICLNHTYAIGWEGVRQFFLSTRTLTGSENLLESAHWMTEWIDPRRCRHEKSDVNPIFRLLTIKLRDSYYSPLSCLASIQNLVRRSAPSKTDRLLMCVGDKKIRCVSLLSTILIKGHQWIRIGPSFDQRCLTIVSSLL